MWELIWISFVIWIVAALIFGSYVMLRAILRAIFVRDKQVPARSSASEAALAEAKRSREVRLDILTEEIWSAAEKGVISWESADALNQHAKRKYGERSAAAETVSDSQAPSPKVALPPPLIFDEQEVRSVRAAEAAARAEQPSPEAVKNAAPEKAVASVRPQEDFSTPEPSIWARLFTPQNVRILQSLAITIIFISAVALVRSQLWGQADVFSKMSWLFTASAACFALGALLRRFTALRLTGMGFLALGNASVLLNGYAAIYYECWPFHAELLWLGLLPLFAGFLEYQARALKEPLFHAFTAVICVIWPGMLASYFDVPWDQIPAVYACFLPLLVWQMRPPDFEPAWRVPEGFRGWTALVAETALYLAAGGLLLSALPFFLTYDQNVAPWFFVQAFGALLTAVFFVREGFYPKREMYIQTAPILLVAMTILWLKAWRIPFAQWSVFAAAYVPFFLAVASWFYIRGVPTKKAVEMERAPATTDGKSETGACTLLTFTAAAWALGLGAAAAGLFFAHYLPYHAARQPAYLREWLPTGWWTLAFLLAGAVLTAWVRRLEGVYAILSVLCGLGLALALDTCAISWQWGPLTALLYAGSLFILSGLCLADKPLREAYAAGRFVARRNKAFLWTEFSAWGFALFGWAFFLYDPLETSVGAGAAGSAITAGVSLGLFALLALWQWRGWFALAALASYPFVLWFVSDGLTGAQRYLIFSAAPLVPMIFGDLLKRDDRRLDALRYYLLKPALWAQIVFTAVSAQMALRWVSWSGGAAAAPDAWLTYAWFLACLQMVVYWRRVMFGLAGLCACFAVVLFVIVPQSVFYVAAEYWGAVVCGLGLLALALRMAAPATGSVDEVEIEPKSRLHVGCDAGGLFWGAVGLAVGGLFLGLVTNSMRWTGIPAGLLLAGLAWSSRTAAASAFCSFCVEMGAFILWIWAADAWWVEFFGRTFNRPGGWYALLGGYALILGFVGRGVVGSRKKDLSNPPPDYCHEASYAVAFLSGLFGLLPSHYAVSGDAYDAVRAAATALILSLFISRAPLSLSAEVKRTWRLAAACFAYVILAPLTWLLFLRAQSTGSDWGALWFLALGPILIGVAAFWRQRKEKAHSAAALIGAGVTTAGAILLAFFRNPSANSLVPALVFFGLALEALLAGVLWGGSGFAWASSVATVLGVCFLIGALKLSAGFGLLLLVTFSLLKIVFGALLPTAAGRSRRGPAAMTGLIFSFFLVAYVFHDLDAFLGPLEIDYVILTACVWALVQWLSWRLLNMPSGLYLAFVGGLSAYYLFLHKERVDFVEAYTLAPAILAFIWARMTLRRKETRSWGAYGLYLASALTAVPSFVQAWVWTKSGFVHWLIMMGLCLLLVMGGMMRKRKAPLLVGASCMICGTLVQAARWIADWQPSKAAIGLALGFFLLAIGAFFEQRMSLRVKNAWLKTRSRAENFWREWD